MEKKRFFVVRFYMVHQGLCSEIYVLAKNADLATCAVKKVFPTCFTATAYVATNFPSFDFYYYNENGESKVFEIKMFVDNLSKTLPDTF
jgi:hypothetical protein